MKKKTKKREKNLTKKEKNKHEILQISEFIKNIH